MKAVKISLSCLILTLFLATCITNAATYTVSNINDNGNGSLRWAIEQANANAGGDTINFSVSGTISPLSALPAITDDETVIDASSRWDGAWPDGQPGITLDGSDAGDVNGLEIMDANSCCIRGLLITSFKGDEKAGVMIQDGQFNTIGGTLAGYRNVISENNDGVTIRGADNNTIVGNYVGTDANGTAAMGNFWTGIWIHAGSQSNAIEGNVISGNGHDGIVIVESDTKNNVVSGNYIGTDVTGAIGLGNSGAGIIIAGGAKWNTIGGATTDERNVVSGNGWDGVRIIDPETEGNTVSGNYIGTDATGTMAIGNTWRGVRIENEAQSNIIGGGSINKRNIISGNNEDGVAILGSGTNNNTVSSNYIGLDVTGTTDLGNLWFGVRIENGSQSNIVGGKSSEDRNIISGNQEAGIGFMGSNTENNIAIGNYIGTDYSGNFPLGNSYVGIGILNARLNVIGGINPGERNIISGNFIGVGIDGSSSNNIILGNYIGTDASGTVDVGNEFAGVGITNEAYSNIIGGINPGKGNIISGNDQYGVGIDGSGSNNMVLGNYIGTDVNGTGSLGNGDGIYCINSFLVIQGNTISKNEAGIRCEGTANTDLGGGPEIRYGYNSIYDNQNYNIYNDTTNTIMAEYNWWGQDPPDPGQFYGSVDYDPWLNCPAKVMLASRPRELNMLREFRDKILSMNEVGQSLTDAYYQNAPELVRIFLQNPDLSLRSAVILSEITPGILFLLDREGGRDMVMTRLLVARIQELLGDISAEGSKELRDTLSMLSDLLDGFKGKRISRMWESLE
jgi:titin